MSTLPGYRPPTPTSLTPLAGEVIRSDPSQPLLVHVLSQPIFASTQPSTTHTGVYPTQQHPRPVGQNLHPSTYSPKTSAHNYPLGDDYLHPRLQDRRHQSMDHSRSHSTHSHGPISLLQGAAPHTATSATQQPSLLPHSYSHSHLHDAHGVLRPGPVHWAVSSSEEEDGGGGGRGSREPRTSACSGSEFVSESKLDWVMRRLMCNRWSQETKQELRKYDRGEGFGSG